MRVHKNMLPTIPSASYEDHEEEKNEEKSEFEQVATRGLCICGRGRKARGNDLCKQCLSIKNPIM